ncbi:MAG: NAD(P)/FAD-dependent oxidoreductase [Pseudorhodoplanes sp.]
MRIAVVGTGIAGNAAAYALSSSRNSLTVYERECRPGGHSHTVEIDYDGSRIAVDIGFIVYNEPNYPDLTALFDRLGIETIPTRMSFSVSSNGGALEWMGGGQRLTETLNGVFAQRSNLVSLPFWRMLHDVLRFNREALADRAAGRLRGPTLGEYLATRRYSERLRRDYLVPMGAAIWSTPVDQMLDFPVENFVAFFDNHRLLHHERPVWRSVRGGSRRSVEARIAPFRDRVRLGLSVRAIERVREGVFVTDSLGRRERFDQVVVAAHSDQALAMLCDPSEQERSVLGAIRYRPNAVYLHRDARLMPKRRRAWAAWNFIRGNGRGEAGGDVAVTYWMNALQGIDPERPLFVSLNPPFEPDPARTFAHFTCDHPQFDSSAFAAQARLYDIQGTNRTWFCGAWTGYGFHEDGLRSGLAVAEKLGGSVPWRAAVPSYAEAAE